MLTCESGKRTAETTVQPTATRLSDRLDDLCLSSHAGSRGSAARFNVLLEKLRSGTYATMNRQQRRDFSRMVHANGGPDLVSLKFVDVEPLIVTTSANRY